MQKFFLRKLKDFSSPKWGASHTEESNLFKGLPKHLIGRKETKKALLGLYKKEFIKRYIKTGEVHVSLNIEKKKEIEKLNIFWKMNKSIFFIVFSILGILLLGCSSNAHQIKINDATFNVEIADNPAERAQGLMFRNYLEENSGMLFIFPDSAQHGFWMKNTNMPLDIIWINKDKEIIFIKKDAQPCSKEGKCSSIQPGEKAKYVLEINSNLTEKYNIEIGDRVEIS